MRIAQVAAAAGTRRGHLLTSSLGSEQVALVVDLLDEHLRVDQHEQRLG